MYTIMAVEGKKTLKIFGLLNDVSFHLAKCCAEDLVKQFPNDFYDSPLIEGMFEFDWDIFIDEKKKELKGDTWAFADKAIAFVNEECVGNSQKFLLWAEEQYNYENFRPTPLYETIAEQAYKEYLNSTKNDYVYLEFSIGEKSIGKLVMELYSKNMPKTCENFKALCTGEKGESQDTEQKLHYKDSVIHRVIKNGWIQGGDTWFKKGDGGESIFGPVFEDENFSISHDRRGTLGMANKGRHTNASQFYITLNPAKWLDTKCVAFGRVIEGTQTLKAIEEQETLNERPLTDVVITNCGVLTFEF